MAFLEDLVCDWGWGTSGLVGIGALIVAPPIFAALSHLLRPMAKGMIWGAVALTDSVRGGVAEVGEQFHDLYTEARSEYEEQSAYAAVAATAVHASRRRSSPRKGSERQALKRGTERAVECEGKSS